MKKFQTLAAALAVGLSGFVAAGHAFAQDEGVTEMHTRPDGAVVTQHVRSDDLTGQVHRHVRVERPDGTTVVHHVVHNPDGSRVIRTRVVHHRTEPMQHVVVHHVYHRPGVIVNRHVTVIHDAG